MTDHPLRAWRARHRLSEAGLGALSGTTGPTIHRIERGTSPGLVGTLRAIADATLRTDPVDCIPFEVLAAWAQLAKSPPKPRRDSVPIPNDTTGVAALQETAPDAL
jgi:transcriptional regulator with XRE-family HTH domain